MEARQRASFSIKSRRFYFHSISTISSGRAVPGSKTKSLNVSGLSAGRTGANAEAPFTWHEYFFPSDVSHRPLSFKSRSNSCNTRGSIGAPVPKNLRLFGQGQNDFALGQFRVIFWKMRRNCGDLLRIAAAILGDKLLRRWTPVIVLFVLV